MGMKTDMGAKTIVGHNLYMLRQVFRYAPLYAALATAVTILEAADTVLCGAVLTQFILDGLLTGVSGGRIAAALGLAAALLTLRYGLQAYLREKVEPEARVRLKEGLQARLYRKAVQIGLEKYDEPAFYTDFVWAMEQGEDRAMAATGTALELLGCLAALAGFGGVAVFASPFALIPAAVYGASQLLLGRMRAARVYRRETELKPLERRRGYYSRVFYLRGYAKELRTSRIRVPLYHGMEETAARIRDVCRREGSALVKLALIGEIVSEQLLLNGGVYGYLLYALLVANTITAGEFLALATSCENIVWRMGDVAACIAGMAEHALYIGRMRAFLALPDMPEGEGQAQAGTLCLEHVHFAYGGAEALRDLDLRIPLGSHIALVGENGAGKTTLVKLLMRLYDPARGSVTLNGRDVRTYGLSGYRGLFSAAFQDFQLYAASVGENVAMEKDWDRERVERALDLVGLPLDPDAPVTREFSAEGLELSTGQAQKLALARCLYADKPIWILDEPSASLDPISEAAFHKRVEELGAGKTVIFISHRLNTTRFVEKIVLMKRGRVAESGTHDELLALNGEYAALWHAQADRYRV